MGRRSPLQQTSGVRSIDRDEIVKSRNEEVSEILHCVSLKPLRDTRNTLMTETGSWEDWPVIYLYMHYLAVNHSVKHAPCSFVVARLIWSSGPLSASLCGWVCNPLIVQRVAGISFLFLFSPLETCTVLGQAAAGEVSGLNTRGLPRNSK